MMFSIVFEKSLLGDSDLKKHKGWASVNNIMLYFEKKILNILKLYRA